MSQNSEYQSNLPDMPMKWHKFLIYFWLWFLLILMIKSASDYINLINMIQEAGAAEAVKGMSLLYLGIVLCIIIGISLIRTRFSLAKFKAGAPKMLSTTLLIMAAFYLLDIIFASMNNIDFDLSNAIPQPIACISTMIGSRRYYNARDQYFVN